jgi:hypothetical protein
MEIGTTQESGSEEPICSLPATAGSLCSAEEEKKLTQKHSVAGATFFMQSDALFE